MKRSPLTIAIGAALIVVFALLLFMFQVRKSECAVVTSFGRVARTETEPGPYGRWPWPIENVYLLDQRIQNFDTKFDEVTLPDQNILLLSAYVGWRIEKPDVFFTTFAGGSIPDAERALEGLVRSAKNEVAGQHPFTDFVSADPQQMKYTQIEEEIMNKVETKVKSLNYGLDIKFVHIKQIGLPESVSGKVFARMTSERQKYVAQITSDGDAEAAKIKSAADHQAALLLADADARALQLKSEGEAQMTKSLQVFEQNPALGTFLLQLDRLPDLLNNKSTLVLDPSMAPLNLLQVTKPANAAPSSISSNQ